MEKELNVTILNFLRYVDKKTNNPKIRIGYILNGDEVLVECERFKGFSELSYFMEEKPGLWDKLNLAVIGQPSKLILDVKNNPINPAKDYVVLKEIRQKNGSISIL